MSSPKSPAQLCQLDVLTLAATLAVFVYGLMSPLLGVLLPTYALSRDQQGMLGLAQALGMVIASLSAGPVVDLKGSKPVLLLGLTLLAASLFAVPDVGRYPRLLTIYFFLGIGGGVIVTGANSLVGAISPERRASALNFLNLFFGLGGIITTAAASYFLTSLALCYSVAVMAVAALLVNAAVRLPGPSGEVGFHVREIPALLSQPALLLLSFFLFLYVGAEVSVWIWLKTYLISIHFDPQAAGGIISYGFAFGILAGRIFIARFLKLPALMLLLVSSVLIGATSFAVLLLQSAAPVTLAVFCLGFSMAPVFPTTLALIGDNFPHGTATAMGIAITSGWIGLAFSSPLIGAVASHGTLRQALLLLPCLAAAMLAVTLVLRPIMRRPVTL
jgi:fucose permease